MLTEASVEASVRSTDLKLARRFYEEMLGLEPAGSHVDGVDVVYRCGGDTRLLVYEIPGPISGAGHTAAHFVVDDVAGTVRELRQRGVRFEEYDGDDLQTVDGVATIGDRHYAWLKDPDLNIIGIHD